MKEEHKKEQNISLPLKGHGGFFYPPIWIGRPPEVENPPIGISIPTVLPHVKPPQKVFDFTFNDKKGFVNSDGFVGICVEDKREAIRSLNTIFGIALISGVFCYAISEPEMAEMQVEPNSLEINVVSMSEATLRARLMHWSDPMNVYRKNPEILEEKIKEFIIKAEIISKDKVLTEDLIFLLEGFTHHQNAEYSQAFIMNWLVIEKCVSSIWEQLLNEREISGDRRKKLLNTALWSTDYLIEVLNFTEKIDNSYYDKLMQLKNKRNRFVHSRELIDQQSSQDALDIATRIVKENMDSFLSKKGNPNKNDNDN